MTALAPVSHRVVFVLLPGFGMLTFAAAIEALQMTNSITGRRSFDWTLMGDGGTETACSAGVAVRLDRDLDMPNGDDTVIVCGGSDLRGTMTTRLVTWLRRVARHGCAVETLCTDAHVLAAAELAPGEYDTIVRSGTDRGAGGGIDAPEPCLDAAADEALDRTADGPRALDLIVALIAGQVGRDTAAAVAARLTQAHGRGDRDTRLVPLPAPGAMRHPKLARVIAAMEQHIAAPISPAVLARDVGLSARQLERLFRRHLNRSPKRYYMDLRLSKARTLLLQTDMSVISVALACGFASPSHFSKCYRARYDTTPYRERGAIADSRADGA